MRLLFWVALFLLVIVRVFFSQNHYPDGQKVRVRGVVVSEPTRFSSFQNLKIAGLSVTLPAYPAISYGDSVVIEGKVAGGVLEKAVLKDIKESDVLLFSLRKSLVNFYEKTLPEPHASLVSGIVLGAKGNFPNDFRKSLRSCGVMHVVVASGMNVSVSIGLFTGLAFLFLPRKKALPVAFLAIWFYVLISGIQSPIVRAAIMGSIVFAGQAAGRVVATWNVLLLSALIMLIIVPSWAVDIGFILSFVASASLILFERKINKGISYIPNFLKFRDDFSTSLAAQIGVAPIIFVSFGQFNPVSPLINALVLWTVPYIMLIGSLGGVVGLVIPELGRLILYLVYPLTWWFVSVVELFG